MHASRGFINIIRQAIDINPPVYATCRSEATAVVFPKEGQMRLAGQASRSNKSEIFWASDHTNNLFLDPEGYLRKLA
jgi:hypothetical protein